MNKTKGTRRLRTKPRLVIDHLIQHGRITEGHALIEYGRFSVAHAIWSLRNKYSSLVPKGKRIETRMLRDVNEQPYAEWHLVDDPDQAKSLSDHLHMTSGEYA